MNVTLTPAYFLAKKMRRQKTSRPRQNLSTFKENMERPQRLKLFQRLRVICLKTTEYIMHLIEFTSKSKNI